MHGIARDDNHQRRRQHDRREHVECKPLQHRSLPIRRIKFEVFGDLAFPAVPVQQQSFLVEVELLARFGGEFEIRALDDRVNRTGFLAETAIDALHHVDVVARRTSAAVFARFRFDGDRLRGTNGLAKLAGNAALFAVGIAAQRVLAAKPRTERAFLKGIVERGLPLEEIARGQSEGLDELPEENLSCGSVECRHVGLTDDGGRRGPSPPSPPPTIATSAGTLSSRAASTDRSDSAAPWPLPSRTGKRRKILWRGTRRFLEQP